VGALLQWRLRHQHLHQGRVTPRARSACCRAFGNRLRPRPAIGAKLAPRKHHPHTFRTGNRLQQAVTIRALRRVFRDCRSAMRAVECGGHNLNYNALLCNQDTMKPI
jgi:hypothetical protein